MKTLLLDNYDSFTFNLFQYLGEVNGEEPIVVRNDEMSWEELAAMDFDNIVLSPGPGTPEREKDFGLCRRAVLESSRPILGVCLGHQGIGHLFDGRIRPAPRVMHGRASEIRHNGGGIFRGIPSPFRAIRYHSLVVDPELPAGLEGTAWTSDGVLMGLAHRSRPIWGVQFHPESICTEHGITLLENFRDLSAGWPRLRTVHSGNGLRPPRPEPSSPSGPDQLSVSWRRIFRPPEAEAVFHSCFASAASAFWLHSAVIREGMSRFSYMGDASGPLARTLSYSSRERRLQVEGGARRTSGR